MHMLFLQVHGQAGGGRAIAEGRGPPAFGVHHERWKSRQERERGRQGPFPGCNLPPPLSFSLNDFREGTHDAKYHPIINSAWAGANISEYSAPFDFRGNNARRGLQHGRSSPPSSSHRHIKQYQAPPSRPPIGRIAPLHLPSPRYKAAAAVDAAPSERAECFDSDISEAGGSERERRPEREREREREREEEKERGGGGR